jgi:hypothetical protein
MTEDLLSFLVVYAREVWRLRERIESYKPHLPPDAAAALERASARLLELGSRYGIEIVDSTGEPYFDGASVHVLAFQERPDIPDGAQIIGETVQPAVRYKGQLLHPGEVIVYRSPRRA